MNRLAVFRDNIRVGTLWPDRKRCFVFCYDRQYLEMPGANPLSLSLPLQESPFEDDSARPFFANLLPEGDIREMITRLLNISKKNDMMLLEKIGGECAGAVSVLPEGSTPDIRGRYIPISSDELESVIGAGPRKPLLVSRKGIRLSLAGAQDKLPVYIRDGQFFLSSGNMPSSHILKPENRYFEETVQNEAFCMILAKNSGLPGLSFSVNDIKNVHSDSKIRHCEIPDLIPITRSYLLTCHSRFQFIIAIFSESE